MRTFAAIVLGLIAAGCSSRAGQGGKCANTSDCSSGLFCVSGACNAVSGGSTGSTNGGTTGSSSNVTPTITTANLDANSGTVTVTGTSLDAVTSVQLTGSFTGSPATLSRSASSTATSLVATLTTALTLAAGQTYNLVLGTASAASAATASVTYTLPAITPSNLATSATCANGATLNWNDGNTFGCGAPTGTVLIRPTDFVRFNAAGTGPWWIGLDPINATDVVLTPDGPDEMIAPIRIPSGSRLTQIQCRSQQQDGSSFVDFVVVQQGRASRQLGSIVLCDQRNGGRLSVARQRTVGADAERQHRRHQHVSLSVHGTGERRLPEPGPLLPRGRRLTAGRSVRGLRVRLRRIVRAVVTASPLLVRESRTARGGSARARTVFCSTRSAS